MNLAYFGTLFKELIVTILGMTTIAEDDRFPVPAGPRWATVAPQGLLVGAVLHGYPGNSFHNAEYREIAESEFNSVTATAYFGWNARDRNDPERFTGLQNVVEWAQQHEFPVHGHVLLYPLSTHHRFTPDMADSEVAQRIRGYIDDFSSRFAGQIYVWDVGNEVIGDDGDLMDKLGLRTHWYGNVDDLVRDYHAFGGSMFVEEDFRLARKNDPELVLILNDYAVEYKSGKILVQATIPQDSSKINRCCVLYHWENTSNVSVDHLAQYLHIGQGEGGKGTGRGTTSDQGQASGCVLSCQGTQSGSIVDECKQLGDGKKTAFSRSCFSCCKVWCTHPFGCLWNKALH